jgi:cytoskeletal protein CcmA (bactofilin family)
MAIDLVFVLRESAPTLFDLALPVAAMASASALLSFGLSLLRRRIGGPAAKVLAALAVLAAPGESRAHFGMHEHEDLLVAAGTVHSGTLVASARTVTVDGVVDGDLVVLTERLVLRGELAGNLFAVAREVDLRGVVHGSLFVGGERSTLAGEVRGDVYSGAESFILAPDGRIARDLTVVADQIVLEGEVGRDANALLAESIEARGSIGRDLRGHARRLVLLESSRIGANVEVSLPEGVAIERRSGAQVGGELQALAHERQRGSDLGRFLELEVYAWMLLHLGAAFVLGMLLHLLAPEILAVRADSPRDLLRGLGIGLATLVAVPLALALAAVTVVGLPVALIGAAGLAAALYVGLVAVGGLIGAALLHPSEGSHGGFGAALAAGLAVLVLLTHLPFLGHALRVVAIVVGLGLLVERALDAWRWRAAPAVP